MRTMSNEIWGWFLLVCALIVLFVGLYAHLTKKDDAEPPDTATDAYPPAGTPETLEQIIRSEISAGRETARTLAEADVRLYLANRGLDVAIPPEGPPEYLFRVVNVLWTRSDLLARGDEMIREKWLDEYSRAVSTFDTVDRRIYRNIVIDLLTEEGYLTEIGGVVDTDYQFPDER